MRHLERNKRNGSLSGGKEIERNFKYFKNKRNEKILHQRLRYRFPKHEAIDQLENVFVFHLETYNDQEFPDAYAAGLYDVNRLKGKWGRNLTPHKK